MFFVISMWIRSRGNSRCYCRRLSLRSWELMQAQTAKIYGRLVSPYPILAVDSRTSTPPRSREKQRDAGAIGRGATARWGIALAIPLTAVFGWPCSIADIWQRWAMGTTMGYRGTAPYHRAGPCSLVINSPCILYRIRLIFRNSFSSSQ